MNFRLLDTDEGVLGLSIGLVTNVVDEGGLGRHGGRGALCGAVGAAMAVRCWRCRWW